MSNFLSLVVLTCTMCGMCVALSVFALDGESAATWNALRVYVSCGVGYL